MENFTIVWAFDPYTDLNDTWQATLGVIDSLDGNKEIKIHPYYVLGQEMVHWVANITPPKLELIQPKVQDFMAKKVANFKRKDIQEPKVIISNGFSTRDDIETFNNELQKLQPQLVVLNTHQRKGLSRFFMGSFTENFLLKCKFPTLVIPPSYKFSHKIAKTLIPTSFNDNEKPFFKDFIAGKNCFKSHLLLYSKVFHPIDAFATSAATALGGAWVSLESFSQEVVVDRMKKGDLWCGEAKEQGLKCEVKVDDNPKDFIESLLEIIKQESIDLIALPSFTGKTEAILLGSNAREIIRSSEVPVLLRHYENL
ncbi:MAG: universal stress protein [Bdellovibrionales bacterium]|nr:universal stress protein [Bdellovibrionales bacterium]